MQQLRLNFFDEIIFDGVQSELEKFQTVKEHVVLDNMILRAAYYLLMTQQPVNPTQDRLFAWLHTPVPDADLCTHPLPDFVKLVFFLDGVLIY